MLKVKELSQVANWKGWYKVTPINFDKTVSFLHSTYLISDFMIIGENIYTKNLAYLKEVN
jgi:hypothetical protein